MVSTTTDTAQPYTRPTGSTLVLIMVSLVLTVIPLQLDTLVTATALPTIAGDLNGFSQLAWIATAFLLTMAIGTIVSGRLGDMFGRKRLHVAAISVFLLASVWAGVSTGMTEFIAARALQGLGAGMAFTGVMAIVADIAPPESRARYRGFLAAVAPVSMIAGPAIGGVITQHLGWRWIFLLNVPLVAIGLVAAVLLLRLPRKQAAGRIDTWGLVMTTVGAAGLVLAASWAGQYGWVSWQVLSAAAVGVVAFAVLVAIERRAVNPVLPLGLFTDRRMSMCLVVMFCAPGVVMMAAVNFVPIFQQIALGQSASSSGLLLLPMLLPAIGVAVASGHLVSKTGRYREAMIVGTLALAAACGLLATMDPSIPIWVMTCYLALAGAGLGLLFQIPSVVIQNSAPANDVGAATGASSFMRMLGSALGVGALGTIFIHTATSSLAHAGVAGLGASSLSTVTPDKLAAMPDQASAALASAVSSGISTLFWVAMAVAAAAIVAALLVPRQRTTTGRSAPV